MSDMSFSLRPLTLEDAVVVLEGRNSDFVRSFMINQHLIAKDEHMRWMEKRVQMLEMLPYYIFSYQSKPLGLVGLSAFDAVNATGEWGFYLWDSAAPRHSGTRMLSAFLDELFLRRELKVLKAKVLASNERSIGLHTKLGFENQQISTNDAALRKNDVILLEILKSIWNDKRHSFLPYIQSVGVIR